MRFGRADVPELDHTIVRAARQHFSAGREDEIIYRIGVSVRQRNPLARGNVPQNDGWSDAHRNPGAVWRKGEAFCGRVKIVAEGKGRVAQRVNELAGSDIPELDRAVDL